MGCGLYHIQRPSSEESHSLTFVGKQKRRYESPRSQKSYEHFL